MDRERELIAITDSLLIERRGAKSDKMCYFKSTGTSNPEALGMFKNTWLPCLGIIKFPSGGHLVKGSCVRGRLGLDTLYTVCHTIKRENPTFYKEALSITDTPEKEIRVLKLFNYFNTWRQMQISIILSDSADFWSNNKDVTTLILSCSFPPDDFPWNYSPGYKDEVDAIPVEESNIDFFTHNPEYDFFRRLQPHYQNSYMKGLTPPGFEFKLSIDPETPVSCVVTPISESTMLESMNQKDSDEGFNPFATYKRDSPESLVDSKSASSESPIEVSKSASFELPVDSKRAWADASQSDPKSDQPRSTRYNLRSRTKGGTRRSRRRLKRSRRK